jgi:DNA-binding YbaB/EbfC family protein
MAIFDKMQQAKKLFSLQKKAKAIQKELKNTEIEAESLNGQIKVVVSADQKLIEISIDPEVLQPENSSKIEKALLDAINTASKEAQKIATNKMKAISGDLGLPGL